MKEKILYIGLIIFTGFIFSACGKVKSIPTPTPIPTPRLTEFNQNEKPKISLIPRSDGHELKLKVENIPSFINQIEYELLYTAVDSGLEIEKGVGDTIKIDSISVTRDLLLGTASCTNGCKYKYDNGVKNGTLSITFTTTNNQVITYSSPFTLTSSKKGLSLTLKSFQDESDQTFASQ